MTNATSDLAGVQVHTHTLAEGRTGERRSKLSAHYASTTVGLRDTAPQSTGVAAASRGLGPAHAALLLVTVVHVRDALASIERGIVLRHNVVDADKGDVLVLAVKTALVAGEDSLHVEAWALAGTVHLCRLLLQLVDLLGAVRVDCAKERFSLCRHQLSLPKSYKGTENTKSTSSEKQIEYRTKQPLLVALVHFSSLSLSFSTCSLFTHIRFFHR